MKTIEECKAFIAENLKLAESPTWPYVFAFAKRMEAKLANNRHKGDREGWLKDHPWNLVERMLDESVEVQQCFALVKENTVSLITTPEETADECADVANFCMMVADSVTSQKIIEPLTCPRCSKILQDCRCVAELLDGKPVETISVVDKCFNALFIDKSYDNVSAKDILRAAFEEYASTANRADYERGVREAADTIDVTEPSAPSVRKQAILNLLNKKD